MDIARPDLFLQFAEFIRTLPQQDTFDRDDLLIPSFRLHAERELSMYYAPFDALNTHARVVLLGITPGWTQMEIAYREARKGLDLNLPADEICARAKRSASFAGAMRTNLISMLDEIELGAALGIRSVSDLFGAAAVLVHTTSVIRYPVFISGKNYTGHNPKMLRNIFLRKCINDMLAPELAAVSQAIVVPLGNAVSEVLQYLVDGGHVAEERCLFGFPHPSGANGRRVRDFALRREQLTRKVMQHFDSANIGIV